MAPIAEERRQPGGRCDGSLPSHAGSARTGQLAAGAPTLMPFAFLTAPVPSMARRERVIFWIAAMVCASSRPLAKAMTLWDWDEALFCLAMREYDVSLHHPHPPGFPLFVGVAKLARLITGDDFRALQSVAMVGGALLFPAVFLLCRELRFRFTTSIVAAALCAFFPNVWFFGGGAFSDVPSITVAVFSVAMLLRGCRDANAYLVGALMLAIAVSIRPQNLLLGLIPTILATWYRARSSARDVIFAAAVATTVVVVAFGSAIHATGPMENYINAVRAHSDYISRVDSFRNPDRPPLWRLFDRFFLKQYQAPALSVVVSILALIGAASSVRERDRRMLLNVLIFAPLAVMAWLTLDRFSISRFSIGYAPMFAILAAAGIARISRDRELVEAGIGGGLIAAFAVWTIPAFQPVRNTPSPTYAAVDAVRQQMDPKRHQLFVAYSMVPFMEYLHPYLPFTRVYDERAMPLSAGTGEPYLLTEIDRTEPGGLVFRRTRGRLWNIARRHYFEVALQPLNELPRFLSGWYAPEHAGSEEWRWMAGRSVTQLPPANGLTILRLVADVPMELVALRPAVTVRLNGQLIDHFVVRNGRVEHDWEVAPRAAGANLLEITIDPVMNPLRAGRGGDARDLGMRVHLLAWGRM